MNLEEVLQSLPADASEAIVEHNFSQPFLKALGFDFQEIVPQFPVSRRAVDHAARKNTDEDAFLTSHKNPFLYMEVKGRTENLSDKNHPDYRRAVLQLKHYLMSPESKTVRWGILTNSHHVQLFRKHGKVVHPVTPCMALSGDCRRLIKDIKRRIEEPNRALIIAVYNNKGGVGKTTTTLNVAATLAMLKKRVLIIDFDPNQSDLGDALNLKPLQGKILDVLKSKDPSIRDVIKPYKFEHPRLKEPLSFDIVLADEDLVSELDETRLKQQVKFHALRRSLEAVQADYDYILIDSPPNWRIFAQKALYAADVVLVPARHDNLHSLQNAGTAITQFIPEAQAKRQEAGEAGPIALPIFMNNAFRETGPQIQLMHQAITRIIKEARRNANGFDLTPYFYPKSRKGHENRKMIAIPYMAYISRADFMHVPAAFAFKPAREQYLNLVKEYFV
ncbi:cobalamin biosynthesis protein CobQ [filamentous cyanobacterium CCP3]|nr:cobalamin biosynthesis protein CobQ [filamentous cyanobacterium CCP3]